MHVRSSYLSDYKAVPSIQASCVLKRAYKTKIHRFIVFIRVLVVVVVCFFVFVFLIA